jgi:transcriptional regulator GlxA family with amidase domain
MEIPVLLAPRDTEMCIIRDIRELIENNPDWRASDAIYRNTLALLQITMARPQLTWQPPIPENLARTAKFIEDHIGDSLLNPTLAQHAGMSVEGFSRAFLQHYGITPARFVSEVRIREASRLLLQTSETIEAIAEITGFPNRAYFSRVFKKITGAAPAGFRKRHSTIRRLD